MCFHFGRLDLRLAVRSYGLLLVEVCLSRVNGSSMFAKYCNVKPAVGAMHASPMKRRRIKTRSQLSRRSSQSQQELREGLFS